MSSRDVQAIRQSRATVFMRALPCAAALTPAPVTAQCASPISLLPFAHAANPGDGSAAAGLVAGGFHAPVGGPQPCQRMQRRRQRDFLAHGIDSSLEFHFAHRTLQCAGPTFCRQDRKRDRAEHRSSREFVVRRLGHGRFGGKIGPKSGTSHLGNRYLPTTCSRHPWPCLPDAC